MNNYFLKIITVTGISIRVSTAQARAMGQPDYIRCYIDCHGRGIIAGTKKPIGAKACRKGVNGFSFSMAAIVRHWQLKQGTVPCTMVGKRIIIDGITPLKGKQPVMRRNKINSARNLYGDFDFDGWPND